MNFLRRKSTNINYSYIGFGINVQIFCSLIKKNCKKIAISMDNLSGEKKVKLLKVSLQNLDDQGAIARI